MATNFGIEPKPNLSEKFGLPLPQLVFCLKHSHMSRTSVNLDMREKIIKLRESGKTYKQIAEELNCTKSTVCYYLGDNQTEKRRIRQSKRRKNNPLYQKIEGFSMCRRKTEAFNNPNAYRKSGGTYRKSCFSIEELLKKIGSNPICYLTGTPIDLSKPETYAFDHIIPASRGGESTLNNLGLTLKKANLSKTDMTVDEFLDLCKSVLTHYGYTIQQ